MIRGSTLARMSGETRVNRWRLPLLVGVGVVLAAVIAIGVGTLIAHDQNSKTTPSAFTSPTAEPSPTSGLDRAGMVACDLRYLTTVEQLLDDPDSVGAILAASKESANDEIRIKAALLSEERKLAVAAKGRADAEKYRTKLIEASEDLRIACVGAGYH